MLIWLLFWIWRIILCQYGCYFEPWVRPTSGAVHSQSADAPMGASIGASLWSSCNYWSGAGMPFLENRSYRSWDTHAHGCVYQVQKPFIIVHCFVFDCFYLNPWHSFTSSIFIFSSSFFSFLSAFTETQRM